MIKRMRAVRLNGPEADREKIKIYLVIFAFLLLMGITGFILLEEISFTNAFYFTIITMATVGYGDIYPTQRLESFWP